MMRRNHCPPSIVSCIFLLACCHYFAVTIITPVSAEGSFSVTIPYGEEECMLIRIPKDQTHIIRGRFDCLDSNTNIPADPVRVALYNNKESMVWSSNYGDSDGSFSRSGTGRHWLCLENGMTYEQQREHHSSSSVARVPRTIGFAIRVKKPTGIIGEMLKREAEDGLNGDVNDATQNLLELSAALNENFDALYDHMSFMKAREMVHRELHEETFTKVVKWNILEICTVVVVTFGQVLNVWYIMSKRGASTRYY